MSEKKCTKCLVVKPFKGFCNNSRSPDGKQSICILCQNKYSRIYRRTKNGVIKDIYSGQLRHSIDRGHSQPPYTIQDLRKWVLSQQIFHDLYEAWISSDYNKWLKPSCDRTDDSQGYSFSRMQIITWFENSEKGRTGINRYKPVIQMRMDGTYKSTFKSAREAGYHAGISEKAIQSCCRGNTRYAGDFRWAYSIPTHNNEVK